MSFLSVEDVREELRRLNAESMSSIVEELARQLRGQIHEELEMFTKKLPDGFTMQSSHKDFYPGQVQRPDSPPKLRETASGEFVRQETPLSDSSSEAAEYRIAGLQSLKSKRDLSQLTSQKSLSLNAPTLRSGRWLSGILRKANTVTIGKISKKKAESADSTQMLNRVRSVSFEEEEIDKPRKSEKSDDGFMIQQSSDAEASQHLSAFTWDEFMLQHRRDNMAANLMATEPFEGEVLPEDLRPNVEAPEEAAMSGNRTPSVRSYVSVRSAGGVLGESQCVAMRMPRSLKVYEQCQPILIRPPPANVPGRRPSRSKIGSKPRQDGSIFSNAEVMLPAEPESTLERREGDSRILLPGTNETDVPEPDLDSPIQWSTPGALKRNSSVLHREGNGGISETMYVTQKTVNDHKLKKHQQKTTLSPGLLRRARCLTFIYKIILNPWFDFVISLFVVCNTVISGIAVDYKARNLTEPVPVVLRGFEILFCVVFVIEIALRIMVSGRKFFFMPGWQWNWFDLTVVLFQVVDELILVLIDNHRSGSNETTNRSSALRVLRVVRMVRVLRFARILRLIQELHTLVSAIISSMKSFFWTVFLLFMINYLFAVFITDMVADHRQSLIGANKEDVDEVMKNFWGNLGYSILSLYESVSGGVDWDTVLRPLMREIHPVGMSLLFSFYTSFSCLVILNLVTGLFVSSAKSTIEENKHFHLVTQLREMFMSSDLDGSGTITWEEFETQLDNPLMEEFFRVIQMDISEARGFFSLIDLDGTGKVNAEQFVMGCLRLRGSAKAIDMTTLMHQTKQSIAWTVHTLHKLDKRLRKIETSVAHGRSRTPSRRARIGDAK